MKTIKGLYRDRALAEIGGIPARSWWDRHKTEVRDLALGAIFILGVIALLWTPE